MSKITLRKYITIFIIILDILFFYPYFIETCTHDL